MWRFTVESQRREGGCGEVGASGASPVGAGNGGPALRLSSPQGRDLPGEDDELPPSPRPERSAEAGARETGKLEQN